MEITQEMLEEFEVIKDLHCQNIGRELGNPEWASVLESFVSLNGEGALDKLQKLNEECEGALMSLDEAQSILENTGEGVEDKPAPEDPNLLKDMVDSYSDEEE